MKICIAIEKFDPSVGGAERYCWDLAHFLAGKGHEVAVICIKAKDPLHPLVHLIEVSCIRFPQALRHLSFGIMHYLKARSLPDHIHFCVGNTFYMNIYQPHGGLHRAWFERETLRFRPALRKAVRLIKRMSLKDIVQRAMEWWTFAVTRPEVVAISEMVSDDIRAGFAYPDTKIHLVPNGIDLNKFSVENRQYRAEIRQRYQLDPNEFVFLFVAQNLQLKGYDVLVRAISMLEELPFKVLIIGPADTSEKKQAMMLGDTMIFGGRASDMEKIYPACDCLVHPTYYDACSLVVLESLASGIPVITTDANGAKMYLTDGGGIVVSPGSPQDLADAMRRMYSDGVGSAPPQAFIDSEGVFEILEGIMMECS
ncbi:MAG TPA: glycosyltransferase family 4 protein [Deltaproteobacteria bacterium]|nr:glycosyltransferase family 4 protein [Deltaproteobacteria bacterium]HPJ95584.1 glycosyltransferase family 4 protein [Deltaproteobacteria bacterium]HPR51496.1 glycosyltransferase family 4 protein [Deltaproteobacteria bacterium]